MWQKDTTVLVHREEPQFSSLSPEEISLNGSVFARSESDYQETLSACTSLSTLSNLTATPLDRKYRYHLFFAYDSHDHSWVESVVRRLESEPYCYKCCFADRDFDQNTPQVQSIVCSIMLSKRVIVVLTQSFLQSSWHEYEEGIAHVTSLSSQRKQRVIPVKLENCEIPEILRHLPCINTQKENFWDFLFKAFCSDGVPYSDSLSTIKSLPTQYPVGFHNGQLLASLDARVQGRCRAHLLFDYEEVPDTLSSPDISFSRQEYADVIRMVGQEECGQRLPWLFTVVPSLVLGLIFMMWCVAFILVIILFPDDIPGTLPVRLCVFALPATVLVAGCILRWRRLKHQKERYAVCMFTRCVQMNKLLHEKSKPVIVASARTNDDIFHIYFVYLNKMECVDHVKEILNQCDDEDIIKLSKLIEVYALHSSYLEGFPIAIRLAVMMSASYCVKLVFKCLPHSLQQRHTRRRQCLCQFIEEFLTAYLPCIRQEADLNNLVYLFYRYLNCHFQAHPVVLHKLGITLNRQ